MRSKSSRAHAVASSFVRNASQTRSQPRANRSGPATIEGSPLNTVSVNPWKIELLEPKLLLSADAMPGVQRIEGTIDQPGEQDVYEFVVTEKARFFFDGVQGDQIQWSLNGPASGTFYSRDLTANADKALSLQAGTYQLRVDGLQDKTGAYTFRLIGEDAATPLTPNLEAQGRLEPGTQAKLYKINLQAGDRVFFQSNASSASGRWTLFDPTAAIVPEASSKALNADLSPFTVNKSGTYWMSIEGLSGSSSAVDYAFNLYAQAKPAPALLTLNTSTLASVPAPGAAAVYQFTMAHAGIVAWDLESGASSMRWTLTKSDGTLLRQNLTSVEDGTLAPQYLQAGTYTFAIESLGRVRSDVRFKLLSSDGATAVTQVADVPTNAQLPAAGGVVRVDMTQPGTISIINNGVISAQSTDVADTLAGAVDLMSTGGGIASVAVTLGDVGLVGRPDADIYRVVANINDELRFALSNASAAMALRLFDAIGQEVAHATGNALNHVVTGSGIYYIGVSTESNQNYDPLTVSAAAPTGVGLTTATLALTRVQPTGGTVADVPEVVADALDLALARNGSATVALTVGDGAYGARDVDMYKIVLAQGETFSISTPNGTTFSGDHFDGYVRLFNSSMTQVMAADDSPNSFVVTQTGVYYLAFSSYSNRSFSPTSANSGGGGPTGTMTVTVNRTAAGTPVANAYGVVTDAFGNALWSGAVSGQNQYNLTVDRSGSYYVWLNPDSRQAADMGGIKVAVTTTAVRQSFSLSTSADTEIAGQLNVGGQGHVLDSRPCKLLTTPMNTGFRRKSCWPNPLNSISQELDFWGI